MLKSRYELDRIVFRTKKDKEFASKFLRDPDGAMMEFDLTAEEKAALKGRDYAKLSRLGLKDELVLWLAMLSGYTRKKK